MDKELQEKIRLNNKCQHINFSFQFGGMIVTIIPNLERGEESIDLQKWL